MARLALTAMLCGFAFHAVPEDCPDGARRMNWVTKCVRHMQGTYRPHCEKWERDAAVEVCASRRWRPE